MFQIIFCKKFGKLTDDEFNKIKNHTIIGTYILSSSSLFKNIIKIVKYHHERFDGTGYPEKRKGDDINFLARITSISDSFDAMTSKRPYRNALPLATVISEFKKGRGKQFDPYLTDVFLGIINEHYDEIEKIQNKYK